MRQLLKKYGKGEKVLLLFLITNLVYAFMILITIPKVMKYANGMNLFDMMPTGYSIQYTKTLLETLGIQGRKTYLYSQIPVDMIYPLLFGITYCLLVVYLLNKIKLIEKPIIYLSLLPIFAGLFDYLENIGIITMLNFYPDFSSLTSEITNVFTIIKSVLSTITFIFLLILFTIFTVKKIKKQKHKITSSSN